MIDQSIFWAGYGLSDDPVRLLSGAQAAIAQVGPGRRVVRLTVAFADVDAADGPRGQDRALSYKDWNADRILTEYRIPRHLHGGIERYLKAHIPAGDFLMAIFRNDCADAMTRAADASAVLAVRQIVEFLNAEVSPLAWGSEARVTAWLASAPERPAPPVQP